MPPKLSTSDRLIPIEPLEGTTFAPFGQVVQRDDALQHVTANRGTATKYLDVTHIINHYDLAPSTKPAKVSTNMFCCRPRSLQQRQQKKVFPVEILERHPFTPQAFVPLGLSKVERNTAYLVIVAPTLPTASRTKLDGLVPPYPARAPLRRRSLRERLLRARPNPFTNDFTSITTPPSTPGQQSTASKLKGSGMPDLASIRAFIARGDQAVTYGPGTWHAPMVVVGESAVDFVVVQYANGVPLEDCQEVELEAQGTGQGLAVVVEESLLRADENQRAKL